MKYGHIGALLCALGAYVAGGLQLSSSAPVCTPAASYALSIRDTCPKDELTDYDMYGLFSDQESTQGSHGSAEKVAVSSDRVEGEYIIRFSRYQPQRLLRDGLIRCVPLHSPNGRNLFLLEVT